MREITKFQEQRIEELHKKGMKSMDIGPLVGLKYIVVDNYIRIHEGEWINNVPQCHYCGRVVNNSDNAIYPDKIRLSLFKQFETIFTDKRICYSCIGDYALKTHEKNIEYFKKIDDKNNEEWSKYA